MNLRLLVFLICLISIQNGFASFPLSRKVSTESRENFEISSDDDKKITTDILDLGDDQKKSKKKKSKKKKAKKKKAKDKKKKAKTKKRKNKKKNKKKRKKKRRKKKVKKGSLAQNQWIAASLALIFGSFVGLHQFYLGHNWMGLLHLVLLAVGPISLWYSLPAIAVLSWIDLYRIIKNKLRPKNTDRYGSKIFDSAEKK